MKQSTCSSNECEKPAKNAGKCWGCYERDRHHRPIRRIGICAHCNAENDYTGRTGPIPKYCSRDCLVQDTRKPASGICLGCGSPVAQLSRGRARLYCRASCRSLNQTHRGKRPVRRDCAQCGTVIDLTMRMANGRLRYPSYTTKCDRCCAHSRPHRYGMTAKQIAERDGCVCKWCDAIVDFSLVGTRNTWAPSVDHIVPWSRGGTNDPANLQLLHRKCNAEKGVRMPNSEK